VHRRAPLYALYAADAISLAGNSVAQLAIPWFVLTTTGSATYTALAVFFNFLPIVLAGFLGGVVVDRLGFRTTSIVADLASSAAVAAIPLLHATVGLDLWALMALVFVGALLDAPGSTARAALLPDLVDAAGVRLERASGIRGGIQQGAQLVGAPLGGVLVATVGATNALWLNAASFLVSAALVAAFVARPARKESDEADGRFFGELAEGLRFVWNERVLRALVLTVLVTNLLDAPLPVVMAVFAESAYGSAADLGLMYGAFGGAALVGSLVYSWVGHRWPRRLTFLLCFGAIPVMYLVLATLPTLPVAVVALALVGLAVGPLNPLIFTVTAEIVPVELRGRVFGAVRAGAWAAIPLGILVGGALVTAIGVGATFLAIGVCYAGVVGYAFLNPAFRRMNERRGSAVAAPPSAGPSGPVP
jgi:MFS family permease